jgi:aryl-alcohol dehydrogenase-like predicted oxidoreductase
MKELARRRLGRLGFEVRPFGLGGATIAGTNVTDEVAVATVRRALELGIEFIDTSAGYGMGESERRIGLALPPEDRRRIRLQTKAGSGTQPKDYSGDGIRRSVEASLKRLRTDYLDVCLSDPIAKSVMKRVYSRTHRPGEAMSVSRAIDELS